jgi:hypothetical protein
LIHYANKNKFDGDEIAKYNSFEITLNNLQGYYSHRDVSDLLVPDPSKTCYTVVKNMNLGLQIMMLTNKKEFKHRNLYPPMKIINVGIKNLQVNLTRLVLGQVLKLKATATHGSHFSSLTRMKNVKDEI